MILETLILMGKRKQGFMVLKEIAEQLGSEKWLSTQTTAYALIAIAKYAGIIPYKKFYDAYHISCSVVNQIDYLVSWNYQHLANVNKERKVIALNMANNYLNNFRIITPLQLIYYES